MTDRIVFPGNPWPTGHKIDELTWTGRLEPTTGLWFDLHLLSADYDADERNGGAVDLAGDSADDWTSRIVWTDYQSCILSSTKWGHAGFLVGTESVPLALAGLATREFLVDKDHAYPDAAGTKGPNCDDHDYAFGIYLLGHDSVAEHRIRFPYRHGGNAFGLDWRGKIALTYTDLNAPYRYGFHATADRVELRHISVARALGSDEALTLLSRVLAEADDFTLTERGDERQFVYQPRA